MSHFFVFLALYCFYKVKTRKILAFDWDLTLDHVSTPADEDVDNSRVNVLVNAGIDYAMEKKYLLKLKLFLWIMIILDKLRFIDFIIVSRNSEVNIQIILGWININSSLIKIIGINEDNKDLSKAEIVDDYFCLSKTRSKRKFVLIDDCHGTENKEIERAAKYSRKNSIPYIPIRVKRCERNEKYSEQGLLNQYTKILTVFWHIIF
jgi:hypothetical protein